MELCWRDPEDDEEPNFEGQIDLPGIGSVTFWPSSVPVPPEELSRSLSIWYGVDLTEAKFVQVTDKKSPSL